MLSSDLQGKPEYPYAQQAFICFKKGQGLFRNRDLVEGISEGLDAGMPFCFKTGYVLLVAEYCALKNNGIHQ